MNKATDSVLWDVGGYLATDLGTKAREELEVETVLGTLDAPPQGSPATRTPWRGTPRFSGTTSSEPLLPS